MLNNDKKTFPEKGKNNDQGDTSSKILSNQSGENIFSHEKINIIMAAFRAVHSIYLMSDQSQIDWFLNKFPVKEGYVYYEERRGIKIIAISVKQLMEVMSQIKIDEDQAANVLEMGFNSGLFIKYEIVGKNNEKEKFEYYSWCSFSQ